MSMLKSIVEEVTGQNVNEMVNYRHIKPGCEVLVDDEWYTVTDVEGSNLVWVEDEDGEEMDVSLSDIEDVRC